MISEKQITGKIEILEDGQVQLREDTIILRDNTEISRLYHRRVLEPGQDITNEDIRLKSVCGIIWTAQVIDDFKKKRESLLIPPGRSLGGK